jgi:uncharacterized membrane protein YecN with MAPEG domain
LGEGTDEQLRRRIGAQGNFVEYVPLALIALGLIEAHAAPSWMVLAMGSILALGRLLHAIAMWQATTGDFAWKHLFAHDLRLCVEERLKRGTRKKG